MPRPALPTELLALVCQNVPRKDLKQLRLVSKEYDRVVVPILFDRVYMSYNAIDLCISRLVITRFREHIRTIVLGTVHFGDDDLGLYAPESPYEEFADIFTVHVIGSGASNPRDEGHCQYAWGVYCAIYSADRETLASGMYSASLSFALTSIPRLRQILLARRPSSRSMSHLMVQDYASYPIQSCTHCKLDALDHISFPPVMQFKTNDHGTHNTMHTVLVSMVASNKIVPEVMVEGEEVGIPKGLNTLDFQLPPLEMAHVNLCFASLTRLRLILEESSCIDTVRDGGGSMPSILPDLLGVATNLEYLAISLTKPVRASLKPKSTIRAMFEISNFSKLKDLILGSFQSDEVELLRFIKQSPHLRQLSIAGHFLNAGSWEHVVSEIHEMLNLTTFELFNALGGSDEPYKGLMIEEKLEPFVNRHLDYMQAWRSMHGFLDKDSRMNE